MIARGTFATCFSRSTVAPCASQRSSAFVDGKRTPTVSMTSSVASWMRRTWSGVRTSSVSLGLTIGSMRFAIDRPLSPASRLP